MSLHLIKLCVGVDSVEDLRERVEGRLREARLAGRAVELCHTTRMTPKKADELLSGGSLYWVIKRKVQCRQKLLDIRPFTDGEGVSRCHLILGHEIVATEWQPRRAFQGWRYLPAADAPADLAAGNGSQEPLPPEMQHQLAELGLL